MKALVTGGSGFIGSRLISLLISEGVSVRVLLRKTSKVDHLAHLTYERVEGDLQDEDSLRKAVKDVDVVFHLAAVLAGTTSQDYFQGNQVGTEKLMKAVLEVNPRLTRFVFVSSLAAGGPSLTSASRRETDVDSPVSFYGQSKLAAEKSIEPFFNKIPVVIIRPPIVYGPRDRATLILAKMGMKKVIPTVLGNTPDRQKFHSIVHVDDLIQALWLVGNAPAGSISSGTRYYVTGPVDLTFREIMKGYSSASGVDAIFLPIPAPIIGFLAAILTVVAKIFRTAFMLNNDKYREVVPDYWICSSQKIRTDLGYQPKVNFSEGVKATVDWYKKEGWL
jgi:nucleoside-diphosphate-sugar epimerase